MQTWQEGHTAPRLAIEVVSATNAVKDYPIAPDKYGASGTEELWIFDPQLAGPRTQGGPFRLQLWRRRDGEFVREHAGDGSFYSPFLEAFAVPTEEGTMLRVAAGADGAGLWLTGEEAALAAKDTALAAKEAALAAKEAAERRVSELEALFAAARARPR